MDNWKIVHRYKSLVMREAVEPLECKKCGNQELITRLDPYDEPMLQCYGCGMATSIGAATLMMMEKAIERYDEGRA